GDRVATGGGLGQPRRRRSAAGGTRVHPDGVPEAIVGAGDPALLSAAGPGEGAETHRGAGRTVATDPAPSDRALRSHGVDDRRGPIAGVLPPSAWESGGRTEGSEGVTSGALRAPRHRPLEPDGALRR